MKRTVSILLFLGIMLCTCACSFEGKHNEEKIGSATTEAVKDETDYLQTLKKMDDGGKEFRILVTTQLERFYDQSNSSSVVVDDAAYRRNEAVNGLFNTKLTYTALDGNSSGSSAFSTNIRTTTLSGDGDCYDLIIGQNYYTADRTTVSCSLRLQTQPLPELPCSDQMSILIHQSDRSFTLHTGIYINGRVSLRRSGYNMEYFRYDSENNLIRKANNRGELWDYTYYTGTKNVKDITEYSFTYGQSLIFPALAEDPDSLITKTPKAKTEYQYNNYGQVLSVISFEAAYDGSGNVVRASGAKILIESYQYDNNSSSGIFGAVISYTASDGIKTEYYYDYTSGRLVATINNGTGQGTCYEYDATGRLTSVLPSVFSEMEQEYYGDTTREKAIYTYNEAGMLESISTDSAVYNISYDISGNREEISVTDTRLASYEYNANNGKLKKLNYGNGLTVEYVYDALDRIKEVWYTQNNGTAVKAYEYTYTAYGQLSRVDNLSDGTSTIYKYAPSWGRFLNADSKINTDDLISYNVFACCNNNPVMLVDSDGHLPSFVITAAIGAVADGIVVTKNGGNVWEGIVIGAAAGGLVGFK